MRHVAKVFFATLALGIAAPSHGAIAQPFPSRLVTMIVPFSAGGTTDALGRMMAEGLKASLKQPVIVENVSGAAGSIALSRVSRATPDGYTLIFGNSATHVIGGVAPAASYDVVNDFSPISLVTTQPLVIITNASVPANNLKELIAWLKANPDKATVGTAGPGSATHLAGLFFEMKTGARLQFVPYRGGGQTMQDLLGGQINLQITQASNALPHVRSGAVKAFAVTASARLAAAPEIPTVDEAGSPGLHVGVWHAIWAPKNTPNDVIAHLNSAANTALQNSATRERLAQIGQELFPRDQYTPLALAALQKAEIDTWWPILKAQNPKGQ